MPTIIRPAGFTGTIQRLVVNNTINGVCNIVAWGGGGGGGSRAYWDGSSSYITQPTLGGNGSGSNFAYTSISADVGDVIDVIVGGPGIAGRPTSTQPSTLSIPGRSGASLFPDLLWTLIHAGPGQGTNPGFENIQLTFGEPDDCEFFLNHGAWDVSAVDTTRFNAREWTVNFPTTGWYTFIMSADTTGTMRFDNNAFMSSDSSKTVKFKQAFVTAGDHLVYVAAQSSRGGTNTRGVAAAILVGQWFVDGETFTFPSTSYAGGGGGRPGLASSSGGGGGGGGGATVVRKNGVVVAVAGGGGGGGGGGALSYFTPGNFVPECNAPGELISITPTQGGTPPVSPGAGGGGGGGGGGFSNISELNAGQYGSPRGTEQAAFGGSYGYSFGDDTEYISGNFQLPARNPNNNLYWNAARGKGGTGGEFYAAQNGDSGYAVLEFEQTGVSVQVDDTWRSVNTVWIQQNSQWREVQQVWMKVNGVWQRTLGTNNSAPSFQNVYSNVGSIIGTNTYFEA
jgi:hypothetical protein